MSAKTLVRIVLVSTAAASLMSAGSLVTSAHAGDFYTRKRVNGVWMTGRFAKHHPVRMAQLSKNANSNCRKAAPTDSDGPRQRR